MKFKVPKSKLFEALSVVQNVVGTKVTIPVLSNVLIEADEGSLTFTTTDLDITMRCSCEAEVKEQGKVTLPVKKLTGIVRELDDGIVSIDLDDDNVANMRCGSYKSKINGMSARDFPVAPTTEGAISYNIDQGKFRDMLRKTHYAAASDDSRAVLTGVLLSFENGKLICVATDGRRLALYETEVDFPVENNRDIVLPPRAVSELQRSLGDEGPLRISLKDKQLIFEYSDMFLCCKLLAGPYPNYKQVVFNNCSNVITINREETVNSPEIGEAVDTVAIKYTGEPLTVIFNPQFMMDPLKFLTSDDVQIELNNASSPGLIKSDIPFLYVIMPLRVNAV